LKPPGFTPGAQVHDPFLSVPSQTAISKEHPWGLQRFLVACRRSACISGALLG
jgi:hypothetical protein